MLAQLEHEGRVVIKGAVKLWTLLPVYKKPASVVHPDVMSGMGSLTLANDHVLVYEPGWGCYERNGF